MGSTGCKKIPQCLLDCNFFKAFREARRSFKDMPPDWALGTRAGFAPFLVANGREALGTFGFVGMFGVAKLTALLAAAVTGVGRILGGTTSGAGLAGNFSFANGLSGRPDFLIGGPPYFTARASFGGCTLTTGKTGGASVIGVLGIWILTEGGVSSTGRIRRSASFKMHHRTSWSISEFLCRNNLE